MGKLIAWDTTVVDVGGGRSRALGDLVDGWGKHVLRLSDELTMDWHGDAEVWGAHDYVAALFLRDFIEDGLEALTSSRSEAAQAVERIDGIFRRITEKDVHHLIRRIEPGAATRSGWWWRRLPRTGPARQEIGELTASDR